MGVALDKDWGFREAVGGGSKGMGLGVRNRGTVPQATSYGPYLIRPASRVQNRQGLPEVRGPLKNRL